MRRKCWLTICTKVYLVSHEEENKNSYGSAFGENEPKAALEATGYDTVIGESGGTLSGGERQRLSIARAIMKDSPIIILDEATANADSENEKERMEAIDELTHEKTIIMIAYRLKTVQGAHPLLADNDKTAIRLPGIVMASRKGCIYLKNNI